MCRHFVLLSLVQVVRLGLDAGPVRQEGVVQDHEVVVEHTQLVALEGSTIRVQRDQVTRFFLNIWPFFNK